MSADDFIFLTALRTSPQLRTKHDIEQLFSYVRNMDALSKQTESSLWSLCHLIRHEYYERNKLLYNQGDIISCWYIILSGSVLIDGMMLLPGMGFGKRTTGCIQRKHDCVILEPSHLIAVDYMDVQQHGEICPSYMYPTPESLMNIDSHFSNLQDGSDCPFYGGDQGSHDMYMINKMKRNSRASDTSSAYSGSDMMQSSVDDTENLEFAGLMESTIDSDDEEEGYAESLESTRDIVREVLEKRPCDRTPDETEIVLESVQNFPALGNMTMNVRRALCAVMVYAVVDEAGTKMIDDGEELDSWSIILNGRVEHEYDGKTERLSLGQSFGVTPTKEKMFHQGLMRTLVDDCQFALIPQDIYYQILSQGEENIHRHYDSGGNITFVTEHRVLDNGNKEGQIIIRGNIEMLLHHLIEDQSRVDPSYVEDFLLTYRAVLDSPVPLINKLMQWFTNPELKEKVIWIVLHWVNNHFSDFETDTDTCEFLEKFEECLEEEKWAQQCRLLNLACKTKASIRTITITRATREEILHFSILGGSENGNGIFVSKVEKGSKADDAGLKKSDEILEVNNNSFKSITHTRALELLRSTTHLSISVKRNYAGYKEMIHKSDESKPIKRGSFTHHKARLSAPDIHYNSVNKSDKGHKPGSRTISNRMRIRKALQKFNFISKSLNTDKELNASDDDLCNRSSHKSSMSSSSTNLHTINNLSTSNPDLPNIIADPSHNFPDDVLKIYRVDQTYKFFPIHKETAAREVVMLALREFGITEPSSSYSLYEVTVGDNSFVRQKCLADQLTNLAERASLNSRYYLKKNMSTEALVSDDLAAEISRETHVSLTQLNTAELAAQLTLDDFEVFQKIEQTEYLDDLFELDSKFGCRNLKQFSNLVNKEMFWVVSEIVSEINTIKRMKILKTFIKIAKHCKDCKNFNSLFAILSGLRHGSVHRLHNTWEKLPMKYQKLFDDLQEVMDPSRNMGKYRTLLHSEHSPPPLIPFYPICKKDLTFIHLGNDTYVDKIINFEKLRMLAKEIRNISKMHCAKYDPATMYSGTSSYRYGILGTGLTTITRNKNRRASAFPSIKKIFEEAQMTRRVKAYFSSINVIYDEDELESLSLKCEPPQTRRRDTSPATAINSSSSLDIKTSTNSLPKFGAESFDSVRKIMSLTNKVRPHTKHSSLSSPLLTHRTTPNMPIRQTPVDLTRESSSVVSLSSLGWRNSRRSASVGSAESVNHALSSNYRQNHYDTVSEHGCPRLNFDSQSLGSASSHSSPSSHSSNAGSCTITRPAVPPYNVAIQKLSGHNSQSIYAQLRRPPLPECLVSQMSSQRCTKPIERSSTCDGFIGCYQSSQSLDCDININEEDEEQISAV